MAFEQYKQVYCGEGLTLRPKGAPQSITFHLKKKEHKTYRLFTVGETEQFYFWKNEPDSQFLYRMLTDALDTEHAIRDRYCLDLSCKKYENYLKRVYKKVAWPPVLSYLHMVNVPTAWEFGLTVSTKDLTFSKGGYLRMRIDIRLRKVKKLIYFKGEKKMKITKDMLIGDVLDIDRGCAEYFFEIGMHCLGCPASRGESIEQACAVHGTDCDALVEKLNKYFENK